MKIQILHLSDLHCSQSGAKDIRRVTQALLNDLSKLKNDFNINPDLILFTGDLINRGENARTETDLATEIFIDPLLTHLKLNKSRFYIVPGNHEVDRTKISDVFENGLNDHLTSSEILTKYYRELNTNHQEDLRNLKRKLNPFLIFKSKAMDSSLLVSESFFYSSYKLMLQQFSIGIVCLNSAWRSSNIGDDFGRLIIGEDIFNDAIDAISDCDFKFALSHHSFDMLRDWDQKELKLAFAKNIDLFFTGHIHDASFSYVQPLLGSLYISTCASIHSGRVCNGYSIVEIDCDKKSLSVYLRKWYPGRKEFDQETEKCHNGLVHYDNFKCNKEETNRLLKIISFKHTYQIRALPPSIIRPFDGIPEIALKDVFVEPVISDHSSFDKEVDNRKFIALGGILSVKDNVIFFSKKEFGKTTLLKYIQTELLSDQQAYNNIIPVFISFSQIPKNNPRSILRLIRSSLEGTIEDQDITEYLQNGNIVLLIDDFDDFTDDERDKKRATFYEFHQTYPACRCLLTMNEKPTQVYKQESFEVNQKLNSLNYYLCSFKTGGIRKILTKWAYYQHFDVDLMLGQIVFYFQQLQIPVTPMAVTLFIGVLVRDRASKNINNEAYLIENYLETILEKLDPSDTHADLDFRDKESFLAHIAYRMMETGKYEWEKAAFEKEKIAYFTFFGEDPPSQNIFDDFFDKQILQEVSQKISFKFKFWFNFFLAKSMQKDNIKKINILNSSKYIRFSSALAYKSGLDRNDVELLDIIHKKTQTQFADFLEKHTSKSVDDFEIESGLIEFDKEIEKEVRSKNTSDAKDASHDSQYLSYDENDQTIKEDADSDNTIELLTLNSDIIRNTREIDAKLKQQYIKGNVSAYIGMMWHVAESFKEFISDLDKNNIRDALILKTDKAKDIDIDILLRKVREMIMQIIPISIIHYMSDHLSNPKLKHAVLELVKAETNMNVRIFYSLLLLRIDLSSAILEITSLIEQSNSYVIDQIVFMYMLLHCYCTKLEESHLNKLISLMEKIRSKYPSKQQKIPAFVRDTFASDVKQAVLKKVEKEL
jgi:predicted phosphodiesterase